MELSNPVDSILNHLMNSHNTHTYIVIPLPGKNFAQIGIGRFIDLVRMTYFSSKVSLSINHRKLNFIREEVFGTKLIGSNDNRL